MEVAQEHAPNLGDVSDREEEESPIEDKEPTKETMEIRLLRPVLGASSRPRIEVPAYDGSLNAEELVDWIGTMDKYFEYEEVDEEKRVKLVVTKLRGHGAL